MRHNSGILAHQGGVCLPSKKTREGKWFVVKGGKRKDRAIVFNTARARKAARPLNDDVLDDEESDASQASGEDENDMHDDMVMSNEGHGTHILVLHTDAA